MYPIITAALAGVALASAVVTSGVDSSSVLALPSTSVTEFPQTTNGLMSTRSPSLGPTSLFLGQPKIDTILYSLAASVVGGNTDATTYKLDCTSECLIPNFEHTITVGPSTYQAMTVVSADGVWASAEERCAISSGFAVCTELVDYTDIIKSTTSTLNTTMTPLPTESGLAEVAITAGLEQLAFAATNTASVPVPATTTPPRPSSTSGSSKATSPSSNNGNGCNKGTSFLTAVMAMAIVVLAC